MRTFPRSPRRALGSISRTRAALAFAGLSLLTSGSLALAEQPELAPLVVVGDSLSAGFQNFSLHEAQQPNGYASLVAKQAGLELRLPLIAAPGIPAVLELRGFAENGLPIVSAAEGTSPGRMNPLEQPTDLAVPAARVQDALTARPDGVVEGNDGMMELVLGAPGLLSGISRSQIEWAEELHPKTLIVWIGSNDVLLPAWLLGSTDGVTPSFAFAASYAELLTRAAGTGATVVTANVPDITTVAAFMPDREVEQVIGLPEGTLAAFGVPSGSLVKIDGLPAILAQFGTPIDGALFLDPGEIASIRSSIQEYNLAIRATAAVLGVEVVDIAGLVEDIRANGYKLNNKTLTTRYLGGLYSLDGVHPTNTGYAIIANEFIRVMNKGLKTKIQHVNVKKIAEEDPLVR